MQQVDGSSAPGRAPMLVVRWKAGKVHVSQDGIKTWCGALVPDTATRTVPTVDWHQHTNCYNCAYRLWPLHAPPGYLRPANGQDFPIRRACPHGGDPRACSTCTPRPPKYWPCTRGCTDPRDHQADRRYTKCTVFPPRQPTGPDGRCIGGCESTDRVLHRANPGMFFDLADSDSVTCYHCGLYVCVECETSPVESTLTFCDACP
ncbi:hypothetical protein Vqi01_34490 [Micromonospora qiuiae]|uniref:Uncharacterized protein n=1 Tax=Micromonospora qiuiae TaxID=502268 RepID=A0ABQ4JDP3_9ACTN|nr:hypothetical protein [Micromonospora qiuiae]GIJ28287.1 hypothetical protein Vqi01_34490 [Micromonospora qiuiae]